MGGVVSETGCGEFVQGSALTGHPAFREMSREFGAREVSNVYPGRLAALKGRCVAKGRGRSARGKPDGARPIASHCAITRGQARQTLWCKSHLPHSARNGVPMPFRGPKSAWW